MKIMIIKEEGLDLSKQKFENLKKISVFYF